MMKVSIIGTNGFLSIAMAKYCNMQSWRLDVYGLDKPQNHEFTHFYKVNLVTEELNYAELLNSDIIVYASGAGIQNNLRESISLIYELNVTVPIRICNSLKMNGYKGIFVSFGSVFEMGQTNERHSFTEMDIMTSFCEAPNDYTVSKRIFTRFIGSYKHAFTHWHFIIPTIYGENENPLRLIPYTINAIKKSDPLHFTAGDQTRQYVYVDEVPRLIHISYDRNLKSGVYNIASKEVRTVEEIVALIHKTLGKEVPVDCLGTLQREDVGMKFLVLDGSKLKEAIGFETTIPLSEVLPKY